VSVALILTSRAAAAESTELQHG